MNSIPAEVDVLVVGYGPVGAAIACLLGQYGVRTLVIDKAADIYMAPRAIALDNEALRVLQMAGLADEAFEKVLIPHVRLRSRYAGHFGTINMKGTIDGHPKLVTFYQPDLERALRRTAEAHPCVTAQSSIELLQFEEKDGRIVAEVLGSEGERYSVTSKFLIGADGARSNVRDAIGQEFVGKSYTEDWLIVDASNVPNNIDHVEFVCNSRHPSPHMVAPGGRTRWEFMLAPGESAEQMTSDESIKRLLAPWGPADTIQIERKAVYRFAGRSCKRYSKGRAFLAGDAAHVTPPFAGQGLVSGLRDAANLSWKIAWVVKKRADVSILETYDQERRPHALKMIALAKGLAQVIMPRNVVTAVTIQGLLKLLRMIPQIRSFFEDNRIKPNNYYPEGLLVRGRSKLRRGGLVPQVRVRTPGGSIDLSDNLLGPHLTLVGFGVDPGARLSAASRLAWSDHGGKIVALRLPGSSAGDLRSACEVVADEVEPKSIWGGWCAVVRPDRIVLHDGPVANAQQLILDTLGLLKASMQGRAKEAPAAAVPQNELYPRRIPMKLITAQPARHPSPTTKASALSYVMFDRPDLDRAEQFLTDFGLRAVQHERGRELLFFKGTGAAPFCYVVRKAEKPRFVGLGLRVDRVLDLEALARVPGASAIEPLKWPGGGEHVRLTDPSGFRVHAVCGQASVQPLPHRAALPFNSADTVVRINGTQRPPAAPPDVIRLGHVVLELVDYQETCAWYTRHFGLIPSDVQVLPDGSPAVAFMRLDLGSTPADHHSLGFAQGFAPIYSHSAYEVVDADAVGMGQRVLAEKGWKHAWGMGRHILGSQIFDYWQDPWGDKHEHYCDGDLFTAEQPTGIHAVSRKAMSQWGETMPRSFTKPKLTPSLVAALIKNLRRSPDLTLAKLRMLAKLFA